MVDKYGDRFHVVRAPTSRAGRLGAVSGSPLQESSEGGTSPARPDSLNVGGAGR